MTWPSDVFLPRVRKRIGVPVCCGIHSLTLLPIAQYKYRSCMEPPAPRLGASPRTHVALSALSARRLSLGSKISLQKIVIFPLLLPSARVGWVRRYVFSPPYTYPPVLTAGSSPPNGRTAVTIMRKRGTKLWNHNLCPIGLLVTGQPFYCSNILRCRRSINRCIGFGRGLLPWSFVLPRPGRHPPGDVLSHLNCSRYTRQACFGARGEKSDSNSADSGRSRTVA